MENIESKQHYQVPNGMGETDLKPRDQLIYAVLKSFDGKDGCFPSLTKISQRSGASIPTIQNSLKELEKNGYIEIKTKGRGKEYIFNEYRKFEPFSPEFINKDDVSFTTKSYLVAAQQYMYKDVEGYGKLSLPNVELAKHINMPESTIRKCNNELIRKNYLSVIENELRDFETGCKTDTKLYHLNDLGQAVIWAIANHEERITQNSEDIKELQKVCASLQDQLKESQKLIEKLVKQNEDKEEQYNYYI